MELCNGSSLDRVDSQPPILRLLQRPMAGLCHNGGQEGYGVGGETSLFFFSFLFLLLARDGFRLAGLVRGRESIKSGGGGLWRQESPAPATHPSTSAISSPLNPSFFAHSTRFRCWMDCVDQCVASCSWLDWEHRIV